jgi:hypothetical protein
MKISAEGFFSLKFWVLGIGALMFYSPHVFPYLTENQTHRQLMLGCSFILMGSLSFSITIFPAFRRLLVSQRRYHLYEHSPFLLLGSILFVLGLGALIVGFLMLNGICIPSRRIRC